MLHQDAPTFASWASRARFVAALPRDARVLEVGSGPGRGAVVLEDAGLSVRRTDTTPGFVAMLRADGHAADVVDPLEDDLADRFSTPPARRAREADVRHTEFWQRMETALGRTYARSWADQFVITDLGGRTASEALAAGEDPKQVWRAVWAALELPPVDR